MSSTTVKATLNPKLTINDPGALASGFAAPFSAQFPVDGQDVSFGNGTGSKQINVKAFVPVVLVASTPQTIDLTAISGGYGDAAFAKVKILGFYNSAAAGSGIAVTIGAAGSNAFTGPMGGTGPTFTLPGGQYEVWTNGEAAGWTVDSTHKNLKLDPGSNNVTVYLAIAGN